MCGRMIKALLERSFIKKNVWIIYWLRIESTSVVGLVPNGEYDICRLERENKSNTSRKEVPWRRFNLKKVNWL